MRRARICFVVILIGTLVIWGGKFLVSEMDSHAAMSPRKLRPDTEYVMSPNTKITFTNSYGTMSVLAGQGTMRYYTWEGETRAVSLIPRAERWNGSLGLYFPGAGEHWKDNHGITRGVLEEGKKHFDTLSEAVAWVTALDRQEYVYSSNGLVCGWSKTLPRKQLNVDIWQIEINRTPPSVVPGSRNDKILISKN